MSYILDALKRADAERERGAAPGLHTRHQLPSGSPAHPDTRRPLWLAVAGGVTLLLLATGFWFWRAPGNPPPVAPAEPVAASAPPTVSAPVAPAPVAIAKAPRVQVRPVATPARAVVSVPAPATPASPVAATSAPAPASVPLLAELPQDLRSQLPKITITGSVYSDSPAQRLLLVNNLVLAQGAQVAPDLTLEEIQRRNSVFSFNGTRFRVMH
jgi:general secretion pathway protein B